MKKAKYQVQYSFGLFELFVGKEFEIYYNANFWLIVPIIITLILITGYLLKRKGVGVDHEITH